MEKKRNFKIILIIIVIIGIVAILYFSFGKEIRYRKGISYLESSDLTKATNVFSKLEDYKDSSNYYSYVLGLILIDDGKYEEAKAKFLSLGEFKDSYMYEPLISFLMDVNSASDTFSLDSFTNLKNEIIKAEFFEYVDGYIPYIYGSIDFLNGAYDDSISNFELVLNEGKIRSVYMARAGYLINLSENILKLNSGDLSTLDKFNLLSKTSDKVISDLANKYVSYINGKNFFDEGKFYDAYINLENCLDLYDSTKLYNSCLKARPKTGIKYINTKSKEVLVRVYDNKDKNDMFIKLYSKDNKLIETLYIRDGENGTLHFKAGEYRLALSRGPKDKWFGTDILFGGYGNYEVLLIDGENEYAKFTKGSYKLNFNNKGSVKGKESTYDGF